MQFLRIIVGAVLLVLGLIVLIYGIYFFVDMYGGFAYLQHWWCVFTANINQYMTTAEFSEYAGLMWAVLCIVVGLILVMLGNSLTKR